MPITLWGIVDGQTTANAFYVQVDTGHSVVYDLKKSIKEAKSPMFDNIPADEIQLSKVVVLDNPKNEPLTVIFNYIDNGRKSPRPLRATEKVTEVFGIIPQGTIHFVVHRPGTPLPLQQNPSNPTYAR